MKRYLLILTIITCMFLTACGDWNESKKDKKDENENSPVTLICWTPIDEDIMKSWVKAYEKEHPNISIIIEKHSWEDYWSKLPLALKSGEEPDIFYQHPDFLSSTLEYTESYDKKVVKMNELDKLYDGVDAYAVDDKIYYVPIGYYTAVLLYNKDMWKEAGYTEADFPGDWDSLKERSRSLETFDDSGKLMVSGFTYEGKEKNLIWALNYQQGLPIFKGDNTPNINNHITEESIHLAKQLRGNLIGEEGWKQLLDGKVAICYASSKDYAHIKKLYPNFPLGVMRIPIIKELVPAVDSKQVDLSLGISKYSTDEKKKAANEFIKYVISNEELMMTYAITKGAFPARSSLRNANRIREERLFQLQKAYIVQTVYPGPIPAQLTAIYRNMYRDILVNNEPVEESLIKGQKEAEELVHQIDFKSMESSYEFYDELEYR